MKEYLFHYTSIDSLEKILSNKTIRFTSLSYVDDLDEVETADLYRFGRYCYVSCWTSEETESIPMWKMYTPDMQGVRIKMKTFPFKRYSIPAGSLGNPETFESYIDMINRHSQNLPHIIGAFPQLLEVDYTERDELLYPKVRTENTSTSEEIIVEDGKRKTITKRNSSISYNVNHIGVFKRKCWAFQSEWRYKIIVAPYTYNEYAACKEPTDILALQQRLDDENYNLTEDCLFLEIDDFALANAEILIGPRATKEQIDQVKSIAIGAGVPESNINLSKLRIR